ncbi:hypothetical protein Hdeb2414_s0893g00958541 [Helianthus debilis subsp. tardiflorus]
MLSFIDQLCDSFHIDTISLDTSMLGITPRSMMNFLMYSVFVVDCATTLVISCYNKE